MSVLPVAVTCAATYAATIQDSTWYRLPWERPVFLEKDQDKSVQNTRSNAPQHRDGGRFLQSVSPTRERRRDYDLPAFGPTGSDIHDNAVPRWCVPRAGLLCLQGELGEGEGSSTQHAARARVCGARLWVLSSLDYDMYFNPLRYMYYTSSGAQPV